MRSSILFFLALALLATLVLAAPHGREDKKKKHTTTTKKHTTTKKPTPTATTIVVTSTLPPATTIVPTTNVPTTNAPTTIAPTTAKPTATTKPGPVPSGKATVTIIDQNRFCLMLPPTPGSGTISDNEDRAISFCTSSSLVTGTKQMYSGFIQSAHFVSNSAKGYVQVTGRIKSSAAGLSSNDGGGQNDLRAPSGSMCAGYASYVQLLEPDAQIYCIRCCKNKADCPVNRSTYGCKSVLGGDYS